MRWQWIQAGYAGVSRREFLEGYTLEDMAERQAMEKLEPVGFVRLEWYLARLIALLKTVHGKKQYKWPEELIGYRNQVKKQTAEQALATLERMEARVNGRN